MNTSTKLFYLLIAISLCACNTKKNNSNNPTTGNADTSVVAARDTLAKVSAFSDADTADLKLVAIAINAKEKGVLQQFIDSIQNMQLKYLAIAATIKTPSGETEALSKITNADLKNLAIVLSSQTEGDRQQAVNAIQKEDIKNIAIAKSTQNASIRADAIEKIKNPVLKNFALAITATTVQDQAKYTMAI